jgi:hypothetical protein
MVVPQPPEPQASTSSVGALFSEGREGTPLLAKRRSKANYEIGALTASSWSAIWVACVWYQNVGEIGSHFDRQFSSKAALCMS